MKFKKISFKFQLKAPDFISKTKKFKFKNYFAIPGKLKFYRVPGKSKSVSKNNNNRKKL